MEKIKELKDEAYKIATLKHQSISGYAYGATDRSEAMKAYALLTIAENLFERGKAK